MLYRYAHQKVVISPANIDQASDLLLALLRTGWEITAVIEVPTKKVIVYVRQRVWWRPIARLLKMSRLLSGGRGSYSVKRA